jgi:hypothetical protein
MSKEDSAFLRITGSTPGWEGHVALSEAACLEWRNKFSVNSYWKVHPEFGMDSRRVLEKLSPPFYPEDEFMIWDPGIDQVGPDAIVFINKVVSEQLTLDQGMCFGTDFRVIWGDRSTGVITQLQYSQIVSVERSQRSITLFSKNSKPIEILFSLNTQLPANSQPGDVESFSPLDYLFDLFQLISNHNGRITK